jgi:superfamily I DNA/RNA helicase/mRNA-degrading endonuclease RelE of RelBE toxin-antitoxin system
MADSFKVAISSDFLTAFAALPRQIQGKVTEFINKFRNNPRAPGINYEKLKNGSDKKIYSVRIDDTYRGIVVRQDETGVYLILWVDHHDKAYDWAKNKKCEVNSKTGAIQVYDILSLISDLSTANENSLFSGVSDAEMIELGLPEDQLLFARSIKDAEEFYIKGETFSKDVLESLTWVVEGFPASEVIEMIAAEKEETLTTINLAVALESPATLRSFVVVEGEEELRRIMAEPLEKWRVFLHSTQRKIVNRTYTGPARVLGGAGTGKTVVAMHRAKQLASQMKGNERLLFTTFTANLAADIKDNLRKICSIDEMRFIEVINLDAWVSRYLRDQGYSVVIIYESEVIKLWEDAQSLCDGDLGFTTSFFIDEWNRVVMPQEAFSLEQYIKSSRNGRGIRLDRKMRIQVWNVFESYQNLMKERKVRDINMAMYECRTLIAKRTQKEMYQHIIVDEAQDLSTSAFRLLRALAGSEHQNDLFIVGDSHQRIYKNRTILSQSGIDIRGNSSILKVNYRTTEEIRKFAFALLKGISFDDLDESTDLGDKCTSLTHGEYPKVLSFNDANKEMDFVISEIRRLNSDGVSLKNICIVARTHRLIEDYVAQLTKSGIRSFEIKRNKPDDRGLDGIRISTMHRVKGLEFQYVFVVAVNNKIIPLESAVDHSDPKSEQESITSEKCLFYVSLTRAQKGAYISNYGKISEFFE